MKLNRMRTILVLLVLVLGSGSLYFGSAQVTQGSSPSSAIDLSIGENSYTINSGESVYFNLSTNLGDRYNITVFPNSDLRTEFVVNDQFGKLFGHSNLGVANNFEMKAEDTTNYTMILTAIAGSGDLVINVGYSDFSRQQAQDYSYAESLEVGQTAYWEVVSGENFSSINLPFDLGDTLGLEINTTQRTFNVGDQEPMGPNQFHVTLDNGSDHTNPDELFMFIDPVAISFNDTTTGGLIEYMRKTDHIFAGPAQFDRNGEFITMLMESDVGGSSFFNLNITYHLGTGVMSSIQYHRDNVDSPGAAFELSLLNQTMYTLDGSKDASQLSIDSIYFFDDFNRGDFFNYTGVIRDANNQLEPFFPEGASSLEVRESSPSWINSSDGDFNGTTYFNIILGNQSDALGTEVVPIMVLPTNVILTNGTHLNGPEYFHAIFQFDNLNISETASTYILDFISDSTTYEVIYDKRTGLQVSLNSTAVNVDGTVSFASLVMDTNLDEIYDPQVVYGEFSPALQEGDLFYWDVIESLSGFEVPFAGYEQVTLEKTTPNLTYNASDGEFNLTDYFELLYDGITPPNASDNFLLFVLPVNLTLNNGSSLEPSVFVAEILGFESATDQINDDGFLQITAYYENFRINLFYNTTNMVLSTMDVENLDTDEIRTVLIRQENNSIEDSEPVDSEEDTATATAAPGISLPVPTVFIGIALVATVLLRRRFI